MNKFEQKEYQAQMLKVLYNKLEEEKNYIGFEYKKVGKQTKQAKDWRTDELLWEDEEKTIPKYEDKYDYVKKENLSEEDTDKITVIENIEVALEKML